MLDRLLESKSQRTRSPAGAILSVTTHTAVIAAAVYATAQAHIAPPIRGETLRPLYFPRPTQTAESPSRSVPSAPLVIPRPTIHIVLPAVPTVSVTTPTLDLTSVLSQQRDLPRVGTGEGVPPIGGANTADSLGSVLTAEQVEKQVVLPPGNAAPRYPEALRSAGVEGRLTAMFVVNELGRAEDSTVRFASSANRLFEDAVRTALHRMRFVAAEVGGRKVRQLVQMPFVFTLSK
jgi:periplasmic protein TonB